LLLFAHREAFKYFSGDVTADISCYSDIVVRVAGQAGRFERTPRWKENILDGRRMIFERMRIASQISPTFFIDHAVEAKWNDKGCYFNMMSGKHRASYLVYKYELFIPLKVTQEDYNKYIGTTTITKFEKFLKDNNIFELQYPVLHPYFIKTPYVLKSNFYKLLYDLAHWLSRELYLKRGRFGFDDFYMFDATGYMYPLLQCFRKLGCRVGGITQASEFEKNVDELYHIADYEYRQEAPSRCNLVIALFDSEAGTTIIPENLEYIAVLLNSCDSIERASKKYSASLTAIGSFAVEQCDYVLAIGAK
jgi:hypothetical protein